MDIKINLSTADRLKLGLLKKSWRLSGIMNIEVQATLNNKRFIVPIDHRFGFWFVDNDYLKSRFLDIAAILAVTLGHRKGTVIDIGTNIGLFLYLVTAFDKSRRYIGFEPNILAAAYLQRFIDRNKLQNHNVIPMGLSDQTAVLDLMLSYEVDVSATVIPNIRTKDQYSFSRKVLVNTGDSVLPRLLEDSEDIALVKIDVEGAEKEVLSGLEATVNRYRPVIIFEVLPSSDDAMQDYVRHHTSMSEAEIATAKEERSAKTAAVQQFFERKDYVFYKMHQTGRLTARKSLFEERLGNKLESNFLAVPGDLKQHYAKLANQGSFIESRKVSSSVA